MEQKKIFNIITKNTSHIDAENKQLFEVLYPENSEKINEREFISKKRYVLRRRRGENRDNIRKKIKTRFFNCIIQKMNEKLKNNRSHLFLEKFPQKFVKDISKNANKGIINMTLEKIMENRELYDTHDLNKYYHNLKVIKSQDFQEYKEILNKKYCELFEEYINSKEFKVDEINRLKNKGYNDEYIKKYIFLSRHLIEFFVE